MKAIIAISLDSKIGTEKGLPWHCKMDLKLFKSITENQTVVMGRKTMETLPGKKPLPNRRNIVLSETLPLGDYNGFEIINCPSQLPENTNDLFIIGGAGLYKLFAKDIKEIYVSEIHQQTNLFDEENDPTAVYLDLTLITRGMRLEENIIKGSKGYVKIGRDLGLKYAEIEDSILYSMKKYVRV